MSMPLCHGPPNPPQLSGVTGFENCLFLLLRMLTHLAQLLNVLVGILQPSSVKTRLNAQWRVAGLGQKRKIGAAVKLN